MRIAFTLSAAISVCLAWTAELPVPPLSPPIQGLRAAEVRDMFAEVHNGHMHEAIDIMEPKGTPIRAVVTGPVRKLFLSKPGGNTIYQFDETGTFSFYYAHLDRYADGLREGMHMKEGDILGFVGSTGNAVATAPHLHFAIFRLGPEKEWWKGAPINPYSDLIEAIRRVKD